MLEFPRPLFYMTNPTWGLVIFNNCASAFVTGHLSWVYPFTVDVVASGLIPF